MSEYKTHLGASTKLSRLDTTKGQGSKHNQLMNYRHTELGQLATAGVLTNLFIRSQNNRETKVHMIIKYENQAIRLPISRYDATTIVVTFN